MGPWEGPIWTPFWEGPEQPLGGIYTLVRSNGVPAEQVLARRGPNRGPRAGAGTPILGPILGAKSPVCPHVLRVALSHIGPPWGPWRAPYGAGPAPVFPPMHDELPALTGREGVGGWPQGASPQPPDPGSGVWGLALAGQPQHCSCCSSSCIGGIAHAAAWAGLGWGPAPATNQPLEGADGTTCPRDGPTHTTRARVMCARARARAPAE